MALAKKGLSVKWAATEVGARVAGGVCSACERLGGRRLCWSRLVIRLAAAWGQASAHPHVLEPQKTQHQKVSAEDGGMPPPWALAESP